jgi:ABC-type antimicrobial peptide transport system permease subunit
VLSQGVGLSLIGLGVGFALSLVSTRFLRSMLFGVTELDVPTLASVSILLVVVTLGACYLPAKHAAKTDPIVALRHE